MVSLVIGTGNSGKSLLAEKLACENLDKCKVYLATMKIYDEAGKKRVERHRKQRRGKGFITIEKLYDISGVVPEIKEPMETTILLECVSNLVGNEIYENPDNSSIRSDVRKFADKIFADICTLSESVHNTVIVTNDYEKDGDGYDDATRYYVRLLDLVNEKICQYADKIYDLRKQEE